ncbi:MAG TPA: hypothetical protein VM658_00265 [bacterium]|nr:hypothetical protein [bacterium]
MDIELASTVLVVVAVALLIVGSPIVIYLMERKRRRKLKALAECFSGRVVFRFFHPFVKFDNGGCITKIWARPRSRRTPSYLIVEQQSPLGFKMTVDPRKSILTRKIRIIKMKELESIGPELTQTYIIRSNDEARAGLFFQDPKRKNELDLFFQTVKFSELNADNKKLTLTKINFNQDDILPERMKPVIEALRSFAAAANAATA